MQAFSARLSPLDSKRFGVVAARAEGVTEEAVPELLGFCRQQEVELLIARCDGGDRAAAQALAAAGLVFLDVQITSRGPLSPARSPLIREAVAADRDAIAGLARAGFGRYRGHYHADPRLDLDDCADGYVDWALRGLLGEAADVVYVVETDGRPVAFGMFGRRDEDAVVILVTVAEAARGQGLHTGLLKHGMAWAAEQGAEALLGITGHSNIAAQRNFVKLGILPVASTITFHGWSDQLDLAG